MQNHIKSKLRFASLTVITATYFFIHTADPWAPLIFWALTGLGWIIAIAVYSWKKRATEAFLASNERVLRIFDFIFVLAYIAITGGVAESPYLILIYLGIASVGLYDTKKVGLLYSVAALAALVVFDMSWNWYWSETFETTTRALSHLILLPLFGFLADLLIAHFRQIKAEEQIVLDELVTSLAKAIGSKDAYTLGHSTRVKAYSLAIGKELQLSEEEMFTLTYGALLHDIGKIHIPSSVLNKTGKLTRDEWSQLLTHPDEGARIVGNMSKLAGVRDIILYHHEHFDGKGYPCGLKGDEIPFLASLVHVADSFDAMTTTRSYNEPKTIEEGMAELLYCSGTQFHPLVVQAAMQVYHNGKWPHFQVGPAAQEVCRLVQLPD
ncbi:HD-GYP domain-containing protein [Aneurinibacillus sp. Ricciae_BoGa-3]|uniref:HD-GYP domain-containing protein n=1 Tax=Aneurinibacillus sp. Ricciae_BoGa-3 TaxID=3022697 RepID=UPI002341BF34|nr:HD-GYP domain-containing protein [Aneurinibacillus sp. Ricciae_BoGa-3]WCK53355.1 HD-GYP domain-containing protein [Aneurinibacillus sp. Ricciae_BoGa-3]